MPRTANSSTGAITLRLETPAARMAMISPSAAMRPSPIRMPTSTPNGMVSGSTGGKARANRLTTVVAVGGWLPTSSSNSASTFCRKMTNVASSVPSSDAGEDLAKNVTAEEAKHCGPYFVRLRRRYHRQLGQLILGRMQFQVVDQDRWRDHAGLGGEAGRAHQRERRGAVHEFERRGVVARRQDILAASATLKPRNRMPRTSSSWPSGYTL